MTNFHVYNYWLEASLELNVIGEDGLGLLENFVR